jgi:hypothetical protein
MQTEDSALSRGPNKVVMWSYPQSAFSKSCQNVMDSSGRVWLSNYRLVSPIAVSPSDEAPPADARLSRELAGSCVALPTLPLAQTEGAAGLRSTVKAKATFAGTAFTALRALTLP